MAQFLVNRSKETTRFRINHSNKHQNDCPPRPSPLFPTALVDKLWLMIDKLVQTIKIHLIGQLLWLRCLRRPISSDWCDYPDDVHSLLVPPYPPPFESSTEIYQLFNNWRFDDLSQRKSLPFMERHAQREMKRGRSMTDEEIHPSFNNERYYFALTSIRTLTEISSEAVPARIIGYW